MNHGSTANHLALRATPALDAIDKLERKHPELSLAYVVLWEQREKWRDQVSRHCEPWFDNSAFRCPHGQPWPCKQCGANQHWNAAIAYEQLAGDCSGANYSSARAEDNLSGAR